MELRFALAAWSNAHFDNALYPLGTKHAEHLPRYASLFGCAEADTLHHKMPDAEALAEWVAATPKGFLFLPKMWKRVTHENGGTAAAEAWLDALAPLADAGKLGPILLQYPPQFTREAGWDRMMELLALRPPGTFAVEVRHSSWFVPAFRERLEDLETPLVWSTHPKAFTPPWATAATGFVRFTGTQMETRGRYIKVLDRTADLLEIRKRLAQASWKDTFVVVTNPFEGNAVDSMATIAAALGDETFAKRVRRGPGEVLFPDAPKPGTKLVKQSRLAQE
ncbi:MAG: DUF72 domain-containing protein [Candidatus Thermoplasmatota archaeon]